MLLVAPDPRLGIAPDRIARVRVLLDAVPAAPGVAVALPGGPDGLLDALVIRPDAVVGLAPPEGQGPGARSEDGGRRELERLLDLCEPPPGDPLSPLPRRLLSVPAGATAPPDGLTARPRSEVLDAGGVRRIFTALRLADHVPGSDALTAAGFAAHGSTRPAAGEPDRAEPAEDEASTAPHSGAGRAGGEALVGVGAASSGTPTGSRAGRPGNAGPAVGRPTAGPPSVPTTRPVRTAATGRGDGPPGSGPRTGRRPAGEVAGGDRNVRGSAGLVPGWARSWRGLGLGAAAVFLVALLVTALIARNAATSAPATAAPPPPATGAAPVQAGGQTFQRRAQEVDRSCDGHAYGRAAEYLNARGGCLRLERSLWSGTGPQGPTVLAVSVVQMGDEASAAGLKSLIDSSGTGNLSDLMRDGRTFPGAPTGLTDAGYSSAIDGPRLVVAETDWLDPHRTDVPTLNQISAAAVAGGVGRP